MRDPGNEVGIELLQQRLNPRQVKLNKSAPIVTVHNLLYLLQKFANRVNKSQNLLVSIFVYRFVVTVSNIVVV